MGAFVKKDIIVFPFPFSDLSGEKRRPALVIADLRGNDIIACMITGQEKSDDYSITLSKSDYADSRNLKNDTCYIRPNRLITIDANVVLYCAAKISQSKYQEVIEKIIEIIR